MTLTFAPLPNKVLSVIVIVDAVPVTLPVRRIVSPADAVPPPIR